MGRVDTVAPMESQLLELIQAGIPLVRDPWAVLARELDSTGEIVLDRLRSLHGPGGIIREIAAIFDVTRLRYQQSLVAFRLPGADLDAAGAVVADHPGVSHCYARRGEYNLWFTLAVSPDSALGLADSVAALARICRAEGQLLLPTLRRYKLQVRFNVDTGTLASSAPPAGEVHTTPAPRDLAAPTGRQIRAIRALQIDLPLQPDPFAALAHREGLSADDLLVCAADFLAAGWLRRYAAVVHHRQAGAAANVMVVWKVDESLADAAGAHCAASPAVSHCYLRPTADDWPWSLYTMIHGPTREDCLASIDQIAAAAGLTEHAALWTVHEYRKRRIKLFTEDERLWEQANTPG